MASTVGQLNQDTLRQRILKLNHEIDTLMTSQKRHESQRTAATIAFLAGLVLTFLYGLGLLIAIPALVAYFWHGHKVGQIDGQITELRRHKLAYQSKVK